MKLNIKLHQLYIDWVAKLQWWYEKRGNTEKVRSLGLYLHKLLDKQVARRAKAGIPVIQCSVEWGGGEVRD